MSKLLKPKAMINRRGVALGSAVGILIALLFAGIYIASLRRFDAQAMMDDHTIDVLRDGWGYMPGVTSDSNGLHVGYLGRTIVQQDGTGGQVNPPVNLYGTSLRTTGDFEIEAKVQDLKGAASLQFYSSPPIIKDEFRVEPNSLRITLDGSRVTVKQWGEGAGKKLTAQDPSLTNTRPFSPESVNTVMMKRHNGVVLITVNGANVASLPEDGLFDTGALWIGLGSDTANSSWRLTSLRAGGQIEVVNTQLTAPLSRQSSGLQGLASSRRADFLLGAAVALAPLVADAKYAQLALSGNFGQMTTENDLKWQFIHPQRSVYDFHDVDALVAIARKHRMKIHGHTLVFGEANPKWVQDLPHKDARKTMIDHIATTVGRYKGKISSWDVVNEPLSEDGNGLRDHVWKRAMGEEYIKLAFDAARKADPNAKLYINEYGLEADGERWDTFLSLVTRLKAEGMPIDGVGLQAHVYHIEEDAIHPSVLRSHIRTLAQHGLTVRISEMDVDSNQGEGLQAWQYADVLKVCLEEPNCVSWSTWGVTDAYNLWQDDNRVLQRGKDLLWNERYEPTPAHKAIVEVLNTR